ncbi:zgc:171566 [Polypterus senegalus]|nr:zgc:171566 [Polypterus senegalus]
MKKMNSMALVLLVVYGVMCGQILPAFSSIRLNNRPIIGILAQENRLRDPQPQGTSYIAASYVKYLEAAGARVVPIRINLTDAEYEKLFYSINGLLLPGGEVDLETSQYARIAKIFYNLAVKANDDSDYFPIWGICLGFEQLTVLTSGKNVLTKTKTQGVGMPLSFTSDAMESRLFGFFPEDLMQALATEDITANYHEWSLSVQNYTANAKLMNFYKILSTNTDGEIEFISTMEAFKYPFYGMQWHPEKNAFEWVDKSGMSHSPSALKAAFYTADFFVNEAKKNFHYFEDEEDESKALIYNYCPVFKGQDSIFIQNYYFD